MAFQIENKNIFVYFIILTHFIVNFIMNVRAIKQSSCYNVKLAVDYSTCAIKF